MAYPARVQEESGMKWLCLSCWLLMEHKRNRTSEVYYVIDLEAQNHSIGYPNIESMVSFIVPLPIVLTPYHTFHTLCAQHDFADMLLTTSSSPSHQSNVLCLEF